jgi:hypothetical protein
LPRRGASEEHLGLEPVITYSSDSALRGRIPEVRDTAYDEDRHTARTGNGPVNLACLRNTAISRHCLTGADNFRKRLRACTRHAHRALEALTTHRTQDQL